MRKRICSDISAGINSFLEQSVRKTGYLRDQIMPKGKYSSVFLMSNEGYCVNYHSNIFCKLQNGECHLNIPQV